MPNSASMSTYTTMMRVNSTGRPYAKDLYDLFAALLIQLPLSDHRSLFRTYPSTFTTDEAVECLGNLEFTNLVSTPNPLDATKPLLTRTTTTFSMSRAMAKTLGQHFINARLVENATDPQNRTMKDRGIWVPTPKGKFVIQDFSHRARVSIKHMQPHLSRIHSFHIVQFERLLDDDQISFSRPNIMDAFKTMMEWLPTDTLMIDDIGGVNNNNLIEYKDTFFGYQCFEWISEYTSVVSKEEAEMIAAEFVQYGWMLQVLDKSDRELSKKDMSVLFKAGRKTQYYLTDKGRQMIESTTNLQSFLKGESSEGGMGAPTFRSRTQSSATTSSSSSSIRTNHSNSSHIHTQKPLPSTPFKTKKEEYASRLLPTTAVTPLAEYDGIVPKALVTKQNPVPTEETHVQDVQLTDHTFGFSSDSNDIHADTYEVEKELDNLKIHAPESLESNPSSIADHCHPHTVSQNSRLQSVLEDPLIRMYFRDFLKSCFCEENINFWVDYTALIKKLGYVVEEDQPMTAQHLQIPDSLCNTLLIHCYVIYNTYFCPDHAPNELNIDHGLRYDIIQYMQSTFTNTFTDDSDDDALKKSMAADASNVPFGSISVSSHGLLSSTQNAPFVRRKKKNDSPMNNSNGSLFLTIKEGIRDSPQVCLFKLMQLYDQVNNHVCRTMAQDSVPRFIKTQRYQDLMKSYYQSSVDKIKESDEENEDSDDLSL
ncbi:uncharacterized protein B0P05DRAFT_562663 [Gilbertella persicaria]|uniref:uncharacterized protein n=1 Tax=Gilbertella persicaria TaxID=101096 RepID=UPI0022209EBE|nr:uncharacterized protein B0P05DRAFT_562663 [Gilbertella persicaria]KAI8051417.1 hypothetical protein B0P05DRAFT_562663 [Gilbertella persicaria]